MTELISVNGGNEYIITLKEITDLIGVEHNKAMKKVEELATEDGFGHLAKIATCINIGNGAVREIDTYQFTKKQAIAVGARLNNTMLMKVINKLEELEKAQLPKLPIELTKKDLALMVIKSEEEKEQLELKLQSAKNTIKAKDEVILAVADLNIRAGDITIADFSKNLAIEGLGQNNLFAWLKARGFLMMDTSPYQQYVERGYFTRKPHEKLIKGEVKYRTMLTPKGTVWLTRLLKAEYEIECEQ